MKVKVITSAVLIFLSAPALAQDGLTFKGYDCLDDCTAHKQGYDWAAENDIRDKEQCEGHANALIEGCHAWVEEQQAWEDQAEGGDYYTFPDDGIVILE